MNKLYASIIALGLSLTAQAQMRTSEELHDIAASQLLDAGVKAQIGGTRQAVSEIQELALTRQLAIYGSEQAGFVVMARNSHFSPILGYSLSSFTPGQEPCGLKWWLAATEDALAQQARRIGEIDLPTDTTTTATGDYTEVQNFIMSQWGQTSPFNDLCPKIGGNEVPCGCVATAMSQILRYYRYPARAVGKGSYTLGSSTSKIPFTFTDSYDYDNMVDNYVYKGKKAAQKTAVAQLARDCGAASNMSYTTAGSGANDTDAAYGLVTNMGYDSLRVIYAMRDFYTEREWMSIIQEEMLAQRPILYGGADENYGGHAFLLTGIDSWGKVYVNWGWNGTADGYYNISLLNPQGILGNSYLYRFNRTQSMIFGLEPPAAATGEAYYHSELIMTEPLKAASSVVNALDVTLHDLYNINYLTFYGEVGYLVASDSIPENQYFFRLFTTEQTGELGPYYGFSSEHTATIPLQEVPAGDYTLMVVSQAVQQEEYYQIVRSTGGMCQVKFSKDADGKITVKGTEIYDSIVEIPAEQESETRTQGSTFTGFFDLNGRKVSKPTNGIFIINGQKVMVK